MTEPVDNLKRRPNFTPVGQQFQRSSDGRTFIDRLVDALEVADRQVPHSQAHDDAMDDVWDLVAEYRSS